MERTKSQYQKRRIYFIEKSFQAKFILKFCLVVFFGGVITTGIIYFFARQSMTVSFMNSRVVVKTTADFLLPILIQTMLVVLVFVSAATIAITLFVSHKLVGPLYRFKRVMESISEGNYLSDFKIRKLDQLQDFSRTFDSMIKKMRSRINRFKEISFSLQNKLDEISDNDVSENKKSSLGEVKALLSELNEEMSRLNT